MADVNLYQAIDLLKAGECVAFPTETVYGLGAILCPKAIQTIYSLKNRPADNPLIVHVSSIEMAKELMEEVSEHFKALVSAFWPGPLTICVKKKLSVPETVCPLPTIAIRMPEHPIALKLIEAAGPLVAPSANISTRPSPTLAAHVRADFPGLPILDGGPCEHGLESTVISLIDNQLLRPGAIPIESIEKLLNTPFPRAQGSKASPGTRYRHYAPSVPLKLYNSYEEYLADPDAYPSIVSNISLPVDYIEINQKNLYATLRSLKGPSAVICVNKDDAVLDRLERACALA